MGRTAFPRVLVSDAPETITDSTHPATTLIGEASYDCYAYDSITIMLTVHSYSGTSPTLDIVCHTSADEENWATIKAMTQVTETASTTMLQLPVDGTLGSAPKTWARSIPFVATVGEHSTTT